MIPAVVAGYAGPVLHAAAAGAALAAAGWIAPRRHRLGRAGTPAAALLILQAVWAAAAAAGPDAGLVGLAALAGSALACLLTVYRLFALDGRDRGIARVRPVVAALAMTAGLGAAGVAGIAIETRPAGATALIDILVLLGGLFVTGMLVLLHNLFAGATATARAVLRWPAAALAVVLACDLNLLLVHRLAGTMPPALDAVRAIALGVAAVLMAVGTARDSAALHIAPSRSVTFSGVALVVIMLYLGLVGTLGGIVAAAGGGMPGMTGPAFEAAVIVALGCAGLMLLPPARTREWLRLVLVKHVFRHRYDYRLEWLRFMGTIGAAGSDAPPLEERAVQALADIVDCPGGVLFLSDEDGGLQLAFRWRWPGGKTATGFGANVSTWFERTGRVADLPAMAAGDWRGDGAMILPDWLRAEGHAFALVPLLHRDRLVGLVMLARPDFARRLDWEDLDLLKVAGRQAGSFLAEQAGTRALGEARRFDEFHRRIAFVIHDIKNLSSQIALLARNADRHADNPAFRTDMVATLRNSADKLSTLLARLGRYAQPDAIRSEPFAIDQSVRRLVAGFAASRAVVIARCEPGIVQGDAEGFEQAAAHILQNALDASAAGVPVVIHAGVDAAGGFVTIADGGSGMAPEFVRSQLFRPFVSDKPGGFGIGAFEARELLRAMGGRIEVDSQIGIGTRFTLRLPLACAGSGVAAPGPAARLAAAGIAA